MRRCSMRCAAACIVLLLCSAGLHGELKKDAEELSVKADEFMNAAETKDAGAQRDEALQKARVLLEKAVGLYAKYMEEHPAEAGVLSSKLIEINAKILWCNKLTTSDFDLSKVPPAGKIMGRDLPETASDSWSVSKITSEYINKLPDDAERTRNEGNVIAFLHTISSYAKRRMFMEAKFLCMKRLNESHSGIPVRLIKQVLTELGHIDMFIQDVYSTALEMKGRELTDAKTVSQQELKGKVNRFNRGILYINVDTGEDDTALAAGIPLLKMDDAFLVQNVKNKSKTVMAGIASLYLLEGNTGVTENVVRRMATIEGKPNDIGPLLLRVQAFRAIQQKEQAHEDQVSARQYIQNKLALAVSCFKQGRFDKTLTYISYILRTSQGKEEFLKPSSEKCKELSGLSLAQLTKQAIENCKICKGSREMTCPTCHGKGIIRWLLGKEQTCTICGGEKKVECTHCKHRLASARNKKMLEKLSEILGETKEEQQKEPESDVDR